MKRPIEPKRRRSAEEIRQLVGRYRSCKQSRAEFAAAEGICPATLIRYLKTESGIVCQKLPSRTRFLEVEHGGSLLSGARQVYRICLPGGVQLEVPLGYSRDDVAGLLAMISAKEAR